VPADLLDYDEQIAQVRRQKEAAIEAGDLDRAAALRDREKQLLADRAQREREWMAGVDVQAVVEENQRLHREVERLGGLLRQHGIEPDDGTSQTA
jgi:ATP-dependent Clp protease ATP-binding subunit ClpC